jgi:hypothetical protein
MLQTSGNSFTTEAAPPVSVWLASDDSAFINGQSIVVDGGLSLGQSWSGFLEYLGKLVSFAPPQISQSSD